MKNCIYNLCIILHKTIKASIRIILLLMLFSLSLIYAADLNPSSKILWEMQQPLAQSMSKFNDYCGENNTKNQQIYCYWFQLLPAKQLLLQYARAQEYIALKTSGDLVEFSYIVRQNEQVIITINIYLSWINHAKLIDLAEALNQKMPLFSLIHHALEESLIDAIIDSAEVHLDVVTELDGKTLLQMLQLPIYTPLQTNEKISYQTQIKFTAYLQANQLLRADLKMNIANLASVEGGFISHLTPPLWLSPILNTLSSGLFFAAKNSIHHTNALYFDQAFMRFKDFGLIANLLGQYISASPMFRFLAFEEMSKFSHELAQQHRDAEKRKLYLALAEYLAAPQCFEAGVETSKDTAQTQEIWFALWQLFALPGQLNQQEKMLAKTHASKTQAEVNELTRLQKKSLSKVQGLLQNNFKIHYQSKKC
ncbi:hypothetical protein [Caedibacter taeniospiralis]|uniref:hypothetical protein n=1 Tax=Caedibacter taeniospiralis TaxID=28907 RepID=UPI000C27D00E|nr:hypothetical protein [Caedibacter taeniospiralis]